MSVTINITDNATPEVQKLIGGLSGEPLHGEIGLVVVPVFRQHFTRLASTNRNKLGARGGFWNRMLSSTTVVATPDAATIRMPREIALRYFGGTVTPKGGSKYLTIPARTEAYGKKASEFKDLRFVKFASGAAALVQRDAPGPSFGKGKSKQGESVGGGVFYWLVTSATIRADKDVLPTDEEILKAAIIGIDSYTRALARRASA